MYLTISFQNGTKIVQTESRTSSSLECYAEVQPILYKDSRRNVVAVQVDNRPSENCAEKSVQSVRDGSIDTKRFEKIPLSEDKVHCSTVRIWLELRMSNGLYFKKEFKLSRTKQHDREVGGLMLSISGLKNFYYIRNSTDMRCILLRQWFAWS